MRFVIVTGMSGAGKSTVLKFLEDIGFYCVDNMPPALITKFAEICAAGSGFEKVAIGVDIRGGKLFKHLMPSLNALAAESYEYSILFLDASDEVLLKRYKETRRSHPLAQGDRIITGIMQEREILTEVRAASTYIVDTSRMLTRELKEQINQMYILDKDFNSLMITVLSFGFKYGIPNDADLVFDVRFIQNPFYIADLKELTGNDKPVRDFVMNNKVAEDFLEHLKSMIDFLIPNYINEGKNQLVIAIGCTGGKHRSVTFANELYDYLISKNQSTNINHRDILIH